MGRYLTICICVLLQLSLPSCTDALATMAVDLGTEFMKVAIVKPGVPIEIALTSDSQRKLPVAVAIHEGERLVGNAALNMALKRPESVYQAIPAIIGKRLDHPAVVDYLNRFPYHQLSYNENTGQLVFTDKEGSTYSAEELFAMLLESAREIAENAIGSPVRSGVITVPSYFTQAERRAVLRAAGLINFSAIQLINSNTAVALNYGVFRRTVFNQTAQYYMFFDLGSSTATATVVSYQVAKHRDGGSIEENPHLFVIGVGNDPTLGTMSFIYRLRDHMARQFNANKKTAKTDVTKNARAMAKLLKEAAVTFKRLSANTEVYAQVETLHEDEDFKLHVTRAELEEMCADLFDRLKQPFSAALSAADLDTSALNEVIIMGGGTRVPKVQALLMELSGRKELGKGVNSDEAAALGAVYQAAYHTPGFRVLRFVIKDYNPYPIAVDFERVPSSHESAEEKGDDASTSSHVRTIIFPRGNPFPQKRAITFNRQNNDMEFFVNYVDFSKEEAKYFHSGTNVSKVTTIGVRKVVERYPTAEPRGVKAHFSLDFSGLLILTHVDTVLHPQNAVDENAPLSENEPHQPSTFERIGNTISGFFGRSSEDSKDTEPERENVTEADSVKEPASDKLPDDKNTTADNTTIPKNVSEKVLAANKTKINRLTALKTIVESVNFEIVHVDSVMPSEEDLERSSSKLHEMRAADIAKRELERAINELESFIFSTRDLLERDDYIQHSTNEERVNLTSLLSTVSGWYDEQGIGTSKEEYTSRLTQIKQSLKPIRHRVLEFTRRPKAFGALLHAVNESETFFSRAIDFSRSLTEHLKKLRRGSKVVPSSAETDNMSTVEDKMDGQDVDATVKQTETVPEDQDPLLKQWRGVFTQVELDSLRELITETKTWVTDSESKLMSFPRTQDPPVLVADIVDKERKLRREVDYLQNKLRLWQMEVERRLRETVVTPAPPPETATTEDAHNKSDETESPISDSESVKEGDVPVEHHTEEIKKKSITPEPHHGEL